MFNCRFQGCNSGATFWQASFMLVWMSGRLFIQCERWLAWCCGLVEDGSFHQKSNMKEPCRLNPKKLIYSDTRHDKGRINVSEKKIVGHTKKVRNSDDLKCTSHVTQSTWGLHLDKSMTLPSKALGHYRLCFDKAIIYYIELVLFFHDLIHSTPYNGNGNGLLCFSFEDHCTYILTYI